MCEAIVQRTVEHASWCDAPRNPHLPAALRPATSLVKATGEVRREPTTLYIASLGARVTSAEGSVKPTAVSHSILVDAWRCTLGRLEPILFRLCSEESQWTFARSICSTRSFSKSEFLHEWFTYLRHEAPIFRHPEPGGPGFWVVTRYDDVVEVGRDGVTYSSEQSRGGVVALEDAERGAPTFRRRAA